MACQNSIFWAVRKNAIAHASGNSSDIRELYQFGGITDLDISNLYALALGEEFDFDKHEIEPLDEDLDCELFELPSRFVKSISSLGESDILQLAAEWSKTEELSCSPDPLVNILKSLVRISNIQEGKGRAYFTLEL